MPRGSGNTRAATSSAMPMTTTLAIVPIPGLWRSGIQPSSTTTLTAIVAAPMSSGVRPAIPCASTVHGVLPRPAATSVPSPIPKRQTPRKRTPSVAGGARHVEPSALHGIVGTRGAGRSAATTRRTLLPRLSSRPANSTASCEQLELFPIPAAAQRSGALAGSAKGPGSRESRRGGAPTRLRGRSTAEARGVPCSSCTASRG